MKRADLRQEILIKTAELPLRRDWYKIHIDGWPEEKINYEIADMHEEGLIEAVHLRSKGGSDWRVIRLTSAGQTFLDEVRADTVWKKAKDRVISATGILTLEGMKVALAAVIRALLTAA